MTAVRAARTVPILTPLSRRLGAPVPVGEFAVYRSLLAAAIAWRLAAVGELSAPGATGAVRLPPMLVGWLGTPPVGVLVAGRVVGIVLAVAVVLQRFPRPLFRAQVVIYALLAAVVSSGGKIRHDETLLLISCIPVAVAPLGRIGYRDRTPHRDAGWPRRIALFAMIIAYTAAGVQKVRWSGLDWAVGDNMPWVLFQAVTTGRPRWPGLTMWVAEHRALPVTMALGTLVLECGFVVALVRRARPWFGVAVVSLHASIWVLMGIDYSAWMLAAGATLLPWERLLDRGEPSPSPSEP